MANTTEMIRLIRHAADRLAEEDHTHYFGELATHKGHSYDKLKVLGASQSLAAAMILAQTTLRFVAVCMEDEPEAESDGQPAEAFTRQQVDRAVRLAEDRNGKPRDWHLFVDFADNAEEVSR